jgi:AcrR family transcriptional regulator
MSPAELAVRERLLAAAIALIREHGPAGLTQPRVAKAAGISQSHLTYYFPTREALRNAVLERAALGQLAGIKRAFATQSDSDTLAKVLETALGQAENSRLLVSFLLAADQDTAARKIFHDLVNGMRAEIAAAATRIGIANDPANVALIHTAGVGLAVLNLALGDTALQPRPAAAITALFRLLADKKPVRRRRNAP